MRFRDVAGRGASESRAGSVESRLQPPATWAPTIAALTFCFFYSSAFVANKVNLRYAPPLWNLTIRCTIAGLIVLAYTGLRRLPAPGGWRDYLRLIVFGLFNTALYMLFTLWGLTEVSAGTAAMIASTHPLLLALVAPVALKEPLTPSKAGGIALGVAGVGWVMATRAESDNSPMGMAWVGAGVLSLILATLLFKWYPPREPLPVANAVQLLASALLLLPLALLDAPPSAIVVNWQLVLGLGYVTIFVNIVGMALWLWLLHHGEASRVSSYYFLTPIMGLLLAAALLGDYFGPRDLVGLVAVAGGIWLVNRKGKTVEPG